MGPESETQNSQEIPRSSESTHETEANAYKGADMLETPSGGSFIHTLESFIAWVKSMVAKNQ